MVPFRSDLAEEVSSGPAGSRLNRILATSRPILLLLMACLVGLPLSAGEPTLAAASVIEAWLSQQASLRTWSAEFVQTRTLKTLVQPLKAKGHLWFSAPDRFRWELGDPVQTIAIRQPKQMFVIYPELKRAERYPLRSGKSGQWQGALALLEAGFPRSRADLESSFRIVHSETAAGTLELKLEPRSPSARRLIPRIEIVIATDEFSLRATELEFADGSTLRNDFSNAQWNPNLDEALFEPRLGNDFKTVEPLGK